MSAEAFIEELGREAAEAVRGLLKQAYERGYREALAGAGQVGAVATGTEAARDTKPDAEIAQVIPMVPPAVAPAPAEPAKVAWSGEEPGADEEPIEDDSADAEAHPPRPIPASTMIASLKRRIFRTFELERFDIDVVICRAGDPNRRQLRGSARLSTYRKEEG